MIGKVDAQLLLFHPLEVFPSELGSRRHCALYLNAAAAVLHGEQAYLPFYGVFGCILCTVDKVSDACKFLRLVPGEAVQSTGFDQSFHRYAVDLVHIQSIHELEDVRRHLDLPCAHDLFDHALADVLDTQQTVAYLAVFRIEMLLAVVDIRRKHLYAHVAGVSNKPRDGIVALFMLPFSPDKSANKRQSAIGKYPVTGLQMYTLSNQFKEISCGSVTISEYYGNYLDYNPYTRLTLFLPFVGEVQLDPDEVMNETVYVDYTVDCLTGEFVAFVSTSTKVLSQYQGNCASQVPTTSADYSRLNSAMLQAAIGAVGAVAGLATGGGAVAGLAAAGAMAQGAASTALNIMNSKVNHSHSGALGGAPGFMGVQTPYLIIHRARQSVPYDANKFKGYPANANMKLSDLEGCGFTTVREIKLDNYPFTEAEAEELRTILGNGIYL